MVFRVYDPRRHSRRDAPLPVRVGIGPQDPIAVDERARDAASHDDHPAHNPAGAQPLGKRDGDLGGAGIGVHMEEIDQRGGEFAAEAAGHRMVFPITGCTVRDFHHERGCAGERHLRFKDKHIDDIGNGGGQLHGPNVAGSGPQVKAG